MAGRGPAPKPAGQRRRRNVPLRGEWVDLEPLRKPVLPKADPEWSVRAKEAWAAWRADPVTARYGPSDLFAVRELARLISDDETAAAELRLRMDGLGLTPKGKRDLRWRLPEAGGEADAPLADVRPLKVVRGAA